MINRQKKRLWLVCMLLALLFMLAGCDGRTGASTAVGEEAQQETEETEDNQLYILLHCNTDTQRIFLESVDTGRQEEFEYNGGTYIRNRYGDSITVGQLQIGELIRISYTEDKLLTEVTAAEDAFVYNDVTGFSIDDDAEIITVLDSKYYYDEALKVFSNAELISLNELSKKDTICIRGVDKKILSLTVTRGHGTVILKNTETFEGGMITIGNVASQKVTEDMTLEIPEGTYKLSVANDGYGGSREITVGRFEELTIDLNTLKGEGPSYCLLTITAVPEDAHVTLSGAEVDCTQPMEIRYGSYRLEAEAEGYVPWSGTLVVNSKEAALTIELEEESEDEDEEESKDEDAEEEEAEEESEDEDESENEN